MGSKKNEITSTFAQWVSKPHYSVTFNQGDHGTISGGNVVDRYEGQMITNSDVPTVKPNGHYTFKGWNPEFTEHAVTSNETYTAVYEYVAATVHFNTNGGETINDVIVDQNSKVENINNPRHKSGIFVGWYSDSGLQNQVDLNTWKMPTPAVETTFYAKWDMNAAKRIVSYVVNGGTATFTSVVKVLVDINGWASTSGSYTLVEADIPTVTADATHEGNPTWVPKNPLGSVLNVNATFSATFAEKRVRVQVVGNDHIDIENGDQTAVIGSTITPIVIRPKSGWGYGYSNDNLTALSGNGLTAIYSGYDNNITISGNLSADTTLTAPTCSASGDFRFIFCDSTSCAEISGMVYNLSEDNKITWLTVNGTTDINSLTKIYGLTAGTNIVLSVKEIPAGFNMPGSDISYGVKGRTDEVCILYGSVGSVLPGTDPTIVEIHQNVVGSESNKLDIFKYDVNINNNTTRLYIQGTKDAKLTGTMGTHTYSIVQLDENKYGYTTSIVSGSLSGSVNTNSGTPAILTTKYLKGEDNNGELEITFGKIGAYVSQPNPNNPDAPQGGTTKIGVKCNIVFSGADVSGNHGLINFVNGVGSIEVGFGGQNIVESTKVNIPALPTCTYELMPVYKYPKYWPQWAKDYVIYENISVTGQIMNTTQSKATITFGYITSKFIKLHYYNTTNENTVANFKIFNFLDETLWTSINDYFGDITVTNGVAEIIMPPGESIISINWLPGCKFMFDVQESSKFMPKVNFLRSNSGIIIDGDINRHMIEIGRDVEFECILTWDEKMPPGTVVPDPNCNIADVQVNGVSIESGVTTFNWNQTLKIVYKNQLQTGGLNALWAAFGETEYTSLVTNLDASVNINTSVVEASWTGLEQAQYDLVNSLKDSKPYIQIYDENGLPSKFVFKNIGCSKLNSSGGGSGHNGSSNSPGSQESPGSGISVRGMNIPIKDENFVDIPLSGLVDEHGNKYPDFTLRFKLVKQDFENSVNTFWDGYIELPDGILDDIRKARVSPDSADEFYLNVAMSYYRSDIENNQEPKLLDREAKFDLSTDDTRNIINSVLGTPGESYDKMNIRITDVIITDEW